MDYLIRYERPDDYRKVEELTRAAFWNLHVPGCNEHYMVHIMRDHADFVPELDLVLEKNGEIIGSIMYTTSRLISQDGEEKKILSFGPLSIHPDHQRKGHGKALIEHSVKLACSLGYEAIAIFGHPGNYIQCGFKSCKRYNVHLDNGAFPAALLVRELKEDVLSGGDWTFKESAVCEFDVNAAEEFDRQFPPMKKEYRKSQEEFYIYSHSQIVW